MKALVTGACGFVGRHLLEHLVASGDTCVGTYIGDGFTKVPGVLYEELDVTDPDACREVIGRERPDIVFHLAGLAFVPDADKSFNKTLSINVGGIFHVLSALGDLGKPTRCLFVSSAEVYGAVPSEEMPIDEGRAPCPVNSYALSKLFGEMVTASAPKGVTPVIVRPFNHIGPGQDSRFMASSFAKQLAEIVFQGAEPVIQVGNIDTKRDLADVRDVVRAYRLCALRGSGVYNVCSGHPRLLREVLLTLIEISKIQVKIEVDPARYRAHDRSVVFGAAARLTSEFGWSPEIPMSQTLSDLYEDWCRRVKS